MKRKIRIALVVLFSPLIILFPFVCYLCPIPIFLGCAFAGTCVSIGSLFKILLFDLTDEEIKREKEEIEGGFMMLTVPFYITYRGVSEFIDPPEKTSRW